MRFTVLTVIIVTAVLIHGGSSVTRKPSSPCENSSHKRKYDEFVKRHILSETFDRNSQDAWKRYLINHGLWCRTVVQSFIENNVQDVKMICSNGGRRLIQNGANAGNLCISNANMLIYDVQMKNIKSNNCDIVTVRRNERPVIAACDKVENSCLPVHFEKYTQQTRSNFPCN